MTAVQDGLKLRVLVTGSRYWRRVEPIRKAFLDHNLAGPGVTVVTGGQQTVDPNTGETYGADYLAESVARAFGCTIERHPISVEEWRRQGRSAGPRRNARMVALGADLCLGFPIAQSRGTRGCMALAADAGITTINYGDPE